MSITNRILPSCKREEFGERIGSVLSESSLPDILDSKKPIISVGDVVSLTLRKYGITPDLSVYDGMTERREMTEFANLVKSEGWDEVVVQNPAGMITCEMFEAIKEALAGKTQIIRVVGEEDLATLPCMILAPVGSSIVYGWPGEGMMVITTDENITKRAKQLYDLMEESE